MATRLRETQSGQLLAFYVPKPRTFFCASCNRDILNRYKYSHLSTKTHARNQSSESRPITRVSYKRLVRRESAKPSIYTVLDDSNGDALESYYRECALEDGTFAAIENEYC